MAAATGDDHQEQEVTDDDLFMQKIMEDDKPHFAQADHSIPLVFLFIITFFLSLLVLSFINDNK